MPVKRIRKEKFISTPLAQLQENTRSLIKRGAIRPSIHPCPPTRNIPDESSELSQNCTRNNCPNPLKGETT